MKLPGFKQIDQQTPEIAKLQENVRQALEPILAIPLLSGVLLQNVALTTGQSNIVEHKLGRSYRGWLIVQKNANANVWQHTEQLLQTRNIDLRCSANCTVSLWIF